ncbi:hypothetical protein ACLGI4_20245 [Streptomyces sp. HMX112]|uniref:hypothetical protein n=1 Tax=Streptomyces sp. HMX112 TaxID=3390850 RepID=UPI003A7F78C5
MTRTARRSRTLCRTAAAGYVGLMAAGGLATALTGPSPADPALFHLSLPGAVLVYAFLLLPLSGLLGAGPDTQVPSPYAEAAGHALFALVNVLVVWALRTGVRRLVAALRHPGPEAPREDAA